MSAKVHPLFKEFIGRESDLFVCTYPKSGTTWVQTLIWLLHSGKAEFSFAHLCEVSPHLELELKQYGPGRLEQMPSPRILKTHFPAGQLPAQGKVVYVLRDVFDVADSYFSQLKRNGGFKGDYQTFCELFLNGQIHPGSWWAHAHDGLTQRKDPRVLVLRFEELHKNLPLVIDRVAAHVEVKVGTSRIQQLCEVLSFENMKASEFKFDPGYGLLWRQNFQSGYTHLRNGEPGRGLKKMNQDQAEKFLRATGKILPVAEGFLKRPECF